MVKINEPFVSVFFRNADTHKEGIQASAILDRVNRAIASMDIEVVIDTTNCLEVADEFVRGLFEGLDCAGYTQDSYRESFVERLSTYGPQYPDRFQHNAHQHRKVMFQSLKNSILDDKEEG